MRNSRILVLFSIIFIAVAGYGMIVPVLPFYARDMGANPTSLGFLFAVYPLMQFIFSPIWGRLSDNSGRRLIILAGMIGLSLSFVLLGLAGDLFTIFLARMLGGIFSSATFPTSYAYIADVTSPKERGTGISWLSASTGLGIFLGPAMGGYLGDIRVDLPFYGAAAIAFIIAVAGYFLLPESLPLEHRKKVVLTLRDAILDPFISGYRFLKGSLGYLLALSFLMNFASANLESTLGLMLEQSLGVGAREVGLVFTLAGIIMVVIQGIFVGPLILRYGEIPLIQTGLVASGLGYLLLPLAPTFAILLWIMGIMSVFSSAMRPAQATLVSNTAHPEIQGIVMGQNNGFMSFGRVVGPITGGILYNFDYAAPYYFASMIFIFGAIYGAIVLRRGKPHYGRESVP
jgi:DHA1 family multidrug resistance protein-like MFS transporter